LKEADEPLYPSLERVREISRQVAIAVGTEAQRIGLTHERATPIEEAVKDKMWEPHYVPLTI
jgi:hypothetical protein